MELKFFNEMPYWLYTPENPGKNKPLVIFLHGSAERGSDGKAVLVRSLAKWIYEGKWRPDAYVICPQCKERFDWNSQVERLKALIDFEVERLQTDRTRISITGISMGGYGTWSMGIHYPEFFSAIAPICGGGLSWRAPALAEAKMPVRTFHGDADPIVPYNNSVEMVEKMNEAGGNAELTIYPGVVHNCWDKAYGETDLLDWLLAQKRENPKTY